MHKDDEKGRDLRFGQTLERLIRLRARRVAEVAAGAGISRAELYNMLRNRPKYSLVVKLRKLAASLGVSLTELVAEAECSAERPLQFGDARTEYSWEFKKYGVSLTADTPAEADLFCGRLVLQPGSESLGRDLKLFGKARIVHLRTLSGSVLLVYGGKEFVLKVNEKATFSPVYTHQVKNMSRTARAALFLAASPGLGLTGRSLAA